MKPQLPLNVVESEGNFSKTNTLFDILPTILPVADLLETNMSRK